MLNQQDVMPKWTRANNGKAKVDKSIVGQHPHQYFSDLLKLEYNKKDGTAAPLIQGISWKLQGEYFNIYIKFYKAPRSVASIPFYVTNFTNIHEIVGITQFDHVGKNFQQTAVTSAKLRQGKKSHMNQLKKKKNLLQNCFQNCQIMQSTYCEPQEELKLLDKELESMKYFLKHDGGKIIYVSGSNGMGKSLLVNTALKDFQNQFYIIEVNLMSFQNQKKIFDIICSRLAGKRISDGVNQLFDALNNPDCILSQLKMCIVIENIDVLKTSVNQEVKKNILYNLFDLATYKNVRIIFVGVYIDFFTQLQGKWGSRYSKLKEQQIVLVPFNANQFCSIFKQMPEFSTLSTDEIKLTMKQHLQRCDYQFNALRNVLSIKVQNKMQDVSQQQSSSIQYEIKISQMIDQKDYKKRTIMKVKHQRIMDQIAHQNKKNIIEKCQNQMLEQKLKELKIDGIDVEVQNNDIQEFQTQKNQINKMLIKFLVWGPQKPKVNPIPLVQNQEDEIFIENLKVLNLPTKKNSFKPAIQNILKRFSKPLIKFMDEILSVQKKLKLQQMCDLFLQYGMTQNQVSLNLAILEEMGMMERVCKHANPLKTKWGFTEEGRSLLGV